jgi:replication factor C subunit 1
MPAHAVLSSARPAAIIAGPQRGMLNFPTWLGKYSQTTRRQRLCADLEMRTRGRVGGSGADLVRAVGSSAHDVLD